jgi:hypothetical protein
MEEGSWGGAGCSGTRCRERSWGLPPAGSTEKVTRCVSSSSGPDEMSVTSSSERYGVSQNSSRGTCFGVWGLESVSGFVCRVVPLISSGRKIHLVRALASSICTKIGHIA